MRVRKTNVNEEAMNNDVRVLCQHADEQKKETVMLLIYFDSLELVDEWIVFFLSPLFRFNCKKMNFAIDIY